MAKSRPQAARNRGLLFPQLRTFRGPRWTSACDPGCVKTWMPRPIAQQLNSEGHVDESLLRRRPTSRFYVSSRPLENRFDTAWTRRRHCTDHGSACSIASSRRQLVIGARIFTNLTVSCDSSHRSMPICRVRCNFFWDDHCFVHHLGDVKSRVRKYMSARFEALGVQICAADGLDEANGFSNWLRRRVNNIQDR